jgi:hypothetical protein
MTFVCCYLKGLQIALGQVTFPHSIVTVFLSVSELVTAYVSLTWKTYTINRCICVFDDHP